MLRFLSAALLIAKIQLVALVSKSLRSMGWQFHSLDRNTCGAYATVIVAVKLEVYFSVRLRNSPYHPQLVIVRNAFRRKVEH